MKSVAFDYRVPASVQDALGLLDELGDRAKVIAGGQSLVPMMNFRLARPEALVDINGLAELDYIREEDGALAVGALTRQRAAELSPLVLERCPLLAEALTHVAHTAIRNRGTVGGSIVHADPSAELPTVLVTLDGALKVADSTGVRRVVPEEFFLTYLTTALAPNELLVEVSFPVLPPGAGWGFAEISRRHGDFAMAAVASVLERDGEGRCTAARIGLGGVAGTPVRATAAEGILLGSNLGADDLQAASQAVREVCETESDYHGSAEYRENLAAVLTRRSLEMALGRLREGRK